MGKINRDDIAAITSRIDAQTVVLIELIAEAHKMDVRATKSTYTRQYDKLAAKYRTLAISKNGDI